MLKMRMLQRRKALAEEELARLNERDAELEQREAELTADADALTVDTPQEERDALEQDSAAHDEACAAHESAKEAKRAEIEDLDRQIRELAAKSENLRPASGGSGIMAGGSEIHMNRTAITGTAARRFFGGISEQQRTEIFGAEEVRSWLDSTRAIMRRDPQQRAITNVGLTIPDVLLGILRAQLEGYSKLYRHVNVRRVQGSARQIISSVPSEAIWTDCCAALNELTMTFYQEAFDCHRVGGYYVVCNANLEDSDIDLTAEILQALAEGIGMALDKAILYGRNASTTMRMPQGIVSRLVQTAAPTDYTATARPWADLHTSNVITIADTVTGADLFREIIRDAGAAKSKYSRGVKTWVMNEATFAAFQADAMSINAAGMIVSGMSNTMPVVGGNVEIIEFIPDNVIIGGYFDLYTLVERAGNKFASSEHVRFLQDDTVFKGTARYDGGPSIAEAFVAIGINGTTPTAVMTFPSDTANAASGG